MAQKNTENWFKIIMLLYLWQEGVWVKKVLIYINVVAYEAITYKL